MQAYQSREPDMLRNIRKAQAKSTAKCAMEYMDTMRQLFCIRLAFLNLVPIVARITSLDIYETPIHGIAARRPQ